MPANPVSAGHSRDRSPQEAPPRNRRMSYSKPDSVRRRSRIAPSFNGREGPLDVREITIQQGGGDRVLAIDAREVLAEIRKPRVVDPQRLQHRGHASPSRERE